MSPYRHLAMLAVLVGCIAAIFAFGRSSGRKAEAADHAPSHAALQAGFDKSQTGLRNAGAALRDLSARARAEQARAAEQQARGAHAAAQAAEAARASRARANALDAELQRERRTCTEGEARICGLPLR